MKTISFLRVKAFNHTGRYMFVPVNNHSIVGTGSPGFGLPSNYNAAIHGTTIWPVGKGTYAAGWMGTKFIPRQPIINFQFTADDASSVYLNKTKLFDTIGWGSWKIVTGVEVIPGREYAISVYAQDIGGAVYGNTGRVYYNDGTEVVKTSTSWVSA